MPSGMADVGIPALFAPEGTKLRPGGGGGSNDASYVSGRLESPLGMHDIAGHYIPQLTAAGWKVEGNEIETPELLVVRLSFKTAANADITGIFTATVLPGTGAVDLHMRAVRNVVQNPSPANLPLNPPSFNPPRPTSPPAGR